MKGLVSTIIPVFNRPEQLRQAVASVLDQTYTTIEIIIVDDGSTDNTADVIRAIQKARPEVIRALSIENSGPGLAREAGRKIVRGEFIQYLDSDDILYPEKFCLQVEALMNNPKAQIAYGKTVYRIQDKLENHCPGKRTTERFEKMLPSFLQSRWWNTLTPLYRREICDRIGPWTDLRHEEDWEYDSRIAACGVGLCFVDSVICEFRQHYGQRLSTDQTIYRARYRDQARARQLIYKHAEGAGIDHRCEEMQHFSRSAFHLARQCGAAGLVRESRQLFDLSRRASGRPNKIEYRLYRSLALVFGWTAIGRLSQWRDRIRS